jgi:murein DD-endopeptidase MepM/ murein hydrolase activator NlpD
VKTPANVDPVKTASTPPAPQQTASEKVASYTPPKQATKALDQVQDDGAQAPDSTGIGKMRWPVKGRVISGFGGPGGDGIDISVPKGTPVKAAENGVVIYAGDGLKEFGNTVLVRHDNGLVTVYGNASELNVKRGQTVKRGEQIALSGMSGNANAPKLHFEIRKNSAPVDPSTYLE